MKRRALWLALALLLVVNALVLTGIARNRTGTPEATLTLTERELFLGINADREENNGVALELDWNREAEWFDQAKLTELGFHPAPDPADAVARGRINRSLPKKAFVVLEYEGEAWRRYQERKERELAELQEKLRQGKVEAENAEHQLGQIEGELRAGSRLFAVDAGRDPRQLRGRYPDNSRYIIAPALVRMTDYPVVDTAAFHGMIESILVDTLHVPRDLQAPLLGLPEQSGFYRGYRHYTPGEELRPRYEVRVHWGQRYEPWVAEVRLIEGE
ncbi:MAG: DUF4824 family protein [Desulfuromonadales bacterium]|nr:DUF4824 family protein [Desulfuromonadales bacterium]